MQRNPLISVVVPLYNESGTLPELISRIGHVVADHPDFRWEVIFVDDGSTDGSSEKMDQYLECCPWLEVIHLSRNFGHQMAITAGVDHARGQAVILMDGDLQDPPELIPEMLRLWRNGYEVVYATRRKRAGDSKWKRFTASVFYRTLALLSETNIPLDTGDFRLMSRPVVEALKLMPERNRFLRGMVSWAGFRQIALPYNRDPRFEGKTKYTFRRMLRLAINGILSFSTAPLQAVFLLGVLFSLGSFLGILMVLYEKFFLQTTIRGWSSLMVGMLFLGGVQLISLGIIGTYVGKIFEEVKQRPLYLVRETLKATKGKFIRVQNS